MNAHTIPAASNMSREEAQSIAADILAAAHPHIGRTIGEELAHKIVEIVFIAERIANVTGTDCEICYSPWDTLYTIRRAGLVAAAADVLGNWRCMALGYLQASEHAARDADRDAVADYIVTD